MKKSYLLNWHLLLVIPIRMKIEWKKIVCVCVSGCLHYYRAIMMFQLCWEIIILCLLQIKQFYLFVANSYILCHLSEFVSRTKICSQRKDFVIYNNHIIYSFYFWIRSTGEHEKKTHTHTQVWCLKILFFTEKNSRTLSPFLVLRAARIYSQMWTLNFVCFVWNVWQEFCFGYFRIRASDYIWKKKLNTTENLMRLILFLAMPNYA